MKNSLFDEPILKSAQSLYQGMCFKSTLSSKLRKLQTSWREGYITPQKNIECSNIRVSILHSINFKQRLRNKFNCSWSLDARSVQEDAGILSNCFKKRWKWISKKLYNQTSCEYESFDYSRLCSGSSVWWTEICLRQWAIILALA